MTNLYFYYLLLPTNKIKRHEERLRDFSYKSKCSVSLEASCSFHAHLENFLLFVAKYFIRNFIPFKNASGNTGAKKVSGG